MRGAVVGALAGLLVWLLMRAGGLARSGWLVSTDSAPGFIAALVILIVAGLILGWVVQ